MVHKADTTTSGFAGPEPVAESGDDPRPPQALRARSLHGVLWTVLQVWTNRLATALTFIVVSRQLQPQQFGLVSLGVAVITILALLADSGLASYLVRTSKINRRSISTAFWTTLLLAAGMAVPLALASVPLADFFNEPGLAPVLRWLSLGLLFAGLGSVPTALLRREMRFKALAARNVAATTSSSVVAVVLALSGAGVWALVAQSLVNNGLSTVMAWWATRLRPGLAWDRDTAKVMLRFGVKVLGVDLMGQAKDRGQDFLVAGVLSATSLGLWTVANRLVRLVTETCSSVILTVATPAFSKMQDDRERLFRAYEAAASNSGALLHPTMFFLAVSSPHLVPLVMGEQWRMTSTLAQIVALTAVVASFSYFDRAIFIALDKVHTELRLIAVSSAIQLTVAAATIHWGLTVMAVALLLRAVLIVPIRFVTLHRTTGMPYGVLVRPLRVLLAASMMGACAALVAHLSGSLSDIWLLTVVAVVCVVVYPAALWLLARSTFVSVVTDVRRLLSARAARP